MHDIVAWCGFLGAWLLVAGPVYQAVLELREEDLESERIRAVMDEVEEPDPVSSWWWLLPPVRLLLQRRRHERHQQAVIDHLSDEDLAAFSSYVNKAMGWVLVGLGGFLIATKESYELIEVHEWPAWVLAVLLGLGTGLSLGHAVVRSRHDNVEATRSRRRAATTDVR